MFFIILFDKRIKLLFIILFDKRIKFLHLYFNLYYKCYFCRTFEPVTSQLISPKYLTKKCASFSLNLRRQPTVTKAILANAATYLPRNKNCGSSTCWVNNVEPIILKLFEIWFPQTQQFTAEQVLFLQQFLFLLLISISHETLLTLSSHRSSLTWGVKMNTGREGRWNFQNFLVSGGRGIGIIGIRGGSLTKIIF